MDERTTLADARQRLRHVFIRDLMVPCFIGVPAPEREQAQRLRINLDLAVREEPGPLADELHSVVDYEKIVKKTRACVRNAHVKLLETLAEQIMAICLEDARVHLARVRLEKLDVFPDSTAGIEIERHGAALGTPDLQRRAEPG
ncbi:dihydroneopterin aldolase [Pendulispora albinea]|uniref:dihydroneopterin aldolase n=1 Tax=Pendulispora albinea TaxID=2741071 RepID=A0ABZ2MBL9_9BACT